MVASNRYHQGDFLGSMQLWREQLVELQTGRLAIWPYTADAAMIWQPETYWGQGFSALALGDFAEARRLAERCVAFSEQRGMGLGVANASYLLTSALLSTGEYERAEQTRAAIPEHRQHVRGKPEDCCCSRYLGRGAVQIRAL